MKRIGVIILLLSAVIFAQPSWINATHISQENLRQKIVEYEILKENDIFLFFQTNRENFLISVSEMMNDNLQPLHTQFSKLFGNKNYEEWIALMQSESEEEFGLFELNLLGLLHRRLFYIYVREETQFNFEREVGDLDSGLISTPILLSHMGRGHYIRIYTEHNSRNPQMPENSSIFVSGGEDPALRHHIVNIPPENETDDASVRVINQTAVSRLPLLNLPEAAESMLNYM